MAQETVGSRIQQMGNVTRHDSPPRRLAMPTMGTTSIWTDLSNLGIQRPPASSSIDVNDICIDEDATTEEDLSTLQNRGHKNLLHDHQYATSMRWHLLADRLRSNKPCIPRRIFWWLNLAVDTGECLTLDNHKPDFDHNADPVSATYFVIYQLYANFRDR